MKQNYNIEFAHIYADERFGEEQIKSIKILKKITNKLTKEGKTFVTSILIDEFHPVVFKLDEDKMLSEFKKHDITVDFLGYESQLGTIADQLIKEIPADKLKMDHFHKPQKEVLILEKEKQKSA